MKFDLWQLLFHVTSFAIVLGILCAKIFPLDVRLGFVIVLVGLLISLTTVTLPRLELRAHVPNDRQLRRWSDIAWIGLPASILIWIGVTVLLARPIFGLNVPFGLAAGVAFFAVFCACTYTRDED